MYEEISSFSEFQTPAEPSNAIVSCVLIQIFIVTTENPIVKDVGSRIRDSVTSFYCWQGDRRVTSDDRWCGYRFQASLLYVHRRRVSVLKSFPPELSHPRLYDPTLVGALESLKFGLLHTRCVFYGRATSLGKQDVTAQYYCSWSALDRLTLCNCLGHAKQRGELIFPPHLMVWNKPDLSGV